MIMTKVPEHPRPHIFNYDFAIPVESAGNRKGTTCPIVTYDEGLGAMSSYESNPQNANFVVASTDHCYPTSRINKVFAQLRVSMSKIMLETDKVHAIRFCTTTIHCAFDDGTAADEVSTLSLNDILLLDSETTDRQTYPLWTDVDLHDYKANANLDMPAETPGLDTDLEIESTAFNPDTYYKCLQYMTNGNKLKTIATKLQWHTLTRNNPTKTLMFHQHSNTKFMNPYAFLGVCIHIPNNLNHEQFGEPGDTTIETSSLQFSFQAKYLEFNHEFNHAML